MGYVELYISLARPFFRREIWLPKRGSPKRYRVRFKTGMCCADASSQRARDNKPLLVFREQITARASRSSAGKMLAHSLTRQRQWLRRTVQTFTTDGILTLSAKPHTECMEFA